MQNNHQNVIECVGFDEDIQSDFCSKFYVFSVYYEYPTFDME